MSQFEGRTYLSRDVCDRYIATIIKKIRERGDQYDLIIGISRGGLVPATCLSHALNVPMTCIDYASYDGENLLPYSIPIALQRLSQRGKKKVLFVDDIIDSGKTMARLSTIAKSCNMTPHVASLVMNVDTDVFYAGNWHYGRSISRKGTSSITSTKNYFDFWWEVDYKENT